VTFIYGAHDWMDPNNAVALSKELDRVRPRAVRARARGAGASCVRVAKHQPRLEARRRFFLPSAAFADWPSS
jgi:hypothetical protein